MDDSASESGKITPQVLPGAISRSPNRLAFQDLPYELIRHIVSEVPAESRLGLVSTCKRIGFIAGEMLWDGRLIARRGEGHPGYGPEKLFEGLQNTKPTKEKPFGRDLKLRFLKRVTFINLENPSAYRNSDVFLTFTSVFEELRASGIEPFPSLKYLETSTPPAELRPIIRNFDLALASVCRPEEMVMKSGYSLPDIKIDAYPQRLLEFAGGHKPAKVMHAPEGSSNVIPIVAYGTRNVLKPSAMFTTNVESSISYIVMVVRFMHPELQHWRWQLSTEECAKRDETVWCFTWESARSGGLPWSYNDASKVEAAVLKAHPGMAGRMEFLPKRPSGGWADLINSGKV
ncbi:hypothetical protein L202_06937 [Cryptococcus amylolentus CBS 6039]|uniref:F-box domain-containing protein n=2 Tax=Cryptococcus amylolentus TaxID=104669 RepID=A0A1E3HEL5_9TREE|nr:hypothetical protein L202_06937 [Cryptococcus amylolentus CBS 6039]ODN74575.1 hypothetical protein L202_06937 [Cryptococcus amylolentus CBS 6039]ODO01540.1 hypothetical protein I350_06360 [Cryptococcus amylolentus CBS 6273]